MKSLLAVIVTVFVFALGVLFGVLVQRYYGAGRVLKTLRVVSSQLANVGKSTAMPVSGIPEEFQGKLSLFILAGQSNMSGRGDVPASQVADPRIFVFGNDYRWRVALEPIDGSAGQVDEVSRDGGPDSAMFGPSLAFARALREQKSDTVIGLIPCAKGDSSIDEWQRNLSDNKLYGSCIKRARAASVMGKITGLLFFQGEADAVDPSRYPGKRRSAIDYAGKFSTFVHDLREDLAAPQLPVIFAQIGTHKAPKDFVNWEIIKEQQAMVKLPCASMITTDDLPLRDGVHFTTESYRTIGERFANAFLNVCEIQCCQ